MFLNILFAIPFFNVTSPEKMNAVWTAVYHTKPSLKDLKMDVISAAQSIKNPFKFAYKNFKSVSSALMCFKNRL